ncbi:membrane-associated phospholipid phosphatase [Actinomadura rupiterrae]|nr:membrane-associated phospholipid phosphatase [Actinomadura rupiterrae]
MPVLLCGAVVLAALLAAGLTFLARPALVGRLAAAVNGTNPVGAVRRRFLDARSGLVRTLGPWGAYLLLTMAAIGTTLVVAWPFGRIVAFRFGQHAIDWPVYHWIEAHRLHGGWASLMAQVTQVGDRPATRYFAVFSMAVTLLLARRRRWVPVLLIAVMFVAQYWGQLALAALVDRGHPPTNPGTYPSGATIRLLAQGGFCVFLIFYYARARGMRWASSPRWTTAAVTLVVLSGAVEGYTRLDLGRHWITDVAGGWLVSGLLVTGFTFAAGAVLPWATGRADRPQEPSGRRQADHGPGQRDGRDAEHLQAGHH